MLDIPSSNLLSPPKDVHVKGRTISDIGAEHESSDPLFAQLICRSRRSLSCVITGMASVPPAGQPSLTGYERSEFRLGMEIG
jgi:hypothetical protein